MDLGSIVLFCEIMLLIAGWLLFQHARTELTARAAQGPVLNEVKALQKSILALLEQLKLEAGQTSAQLEARCVEARDLLAALDRRLEEPPAARPRVTPTERPVPASVSAGEKMAPAATETPMPERHRRILALAEEGRSVAEIARQTGFSEGEVELVLGLRRRTS